MKKQAEIKAFQAVSKETVIKQFLHTSEMPEGWFPTVEEALYNWKDGAKPVEPEKEAEAGTAPKRGRPRKV